MTDDDFRRACNTFGFAPSRALRELLDSVTAQQVLAERQTCVAIIENERSFWSHPDAIEVCNLAIDSIRGRDSARPRRLS